MGSCLRSGLALVTALALAGSARADALLPTLSGETLEGATLELPADTAGKPAVVIATFSKGAGPSAAAWRTRLRADLADEAPAHVVGVAFVDEMPGFVRRMVVSSIRRGVPTDWHASYLVVSTGDAHWREVFGVVHDDAACVLLLDGEGAIRWRAHGTVTGTAIDSLREALRMLAR